MANTSCALGEIVPTLVNKPEDLHGDSIINGLSPDLRSLAGYNTLKAARPMRSFSLELQNIVAESIYLTRFKDSIPRKALSEIESFQGLIDRLFAD